MRSDLVNRKSKIVNLIMSLNIQAHHLLPIWPVMAPAIPFAEGVPDLFVPERLAQGPVVGNIRVCFADGENNVQTA